MGPVSEPGPVNGWFANLPSTQVTSHWEQICARSVGHLCDDEEEENSDRPKGQPSGAAWQREPVEPLMEKQDEPFILPMLRCDAS
jgi:hypothetical protein